MAKNLMMSPALGGFRTVSDGGVADTTDASGDVTHTFNELKHIESKADVEAQAEGGYVANVQSLTGNQATVRVFEDAGASGALSALASSSVTLNLKAEGY